MDEPIRLVKQIKVHNALGEGAIWDHRLQCLYWTDILARQLYRWDFSGTIKRYACPQRLCSFGLTRHPDWLICAFENGFAFFHPQRATLHWIRQIEADLPHTRMNDGRVDRQGRFWAGTMLEDKGHQRGGLYRLDRDRQVKKMLGDVQIANGLCWSPDGKIMYFADSAKHLISRGQFDPLSGDFKDLLPWVHTNDDVFPDGSCVDTLGFLWNAQWGSSSVKRYAPDGQLVLTLAIPCKQPSCVTFGGPNLQHLFVTSAADGLLTESQNASSHNGNVFVFETPYQGLEEPVCQLTVAQQTINDTQSTTNQE